MIKMEEDGWERDEEMKRGKGWRRKDGNSSPPNSVEY